MTEILNLGAGRDNYARAHNVDIVDLEEVDEVVDLDDYPWPWHPDSYGKVLAKHVLEHLERPMRALSEIVRVLEPGGRFELWYPIGHTRFEDPTHKHYWNYNTAAAIAGGRKHSHEHVADLSLESRNVDWHVDAAHWRAYTRLRERLHGSGPWLSQVPGLSGQVVATYRLQP